MANLTLQIIREHEGYRSNAYWDVNAWRVGFGSDTWTDENGKVHKVTKDTVITKADAERDLARRVPKFEQGIIALVGAEKWAALPDEAKAAVTSVAYNYGSLSRLPSLRKAIKTGDVQQIAAAIRRRTGDNDGVNAKRRTAEAELVAKASPKAAPKPAEMTAKVALARIAGVPSADGLPDAASAYVATKSGEKAETYTAPSGRVYKVGAVFGSGEPGSFNYVVTPNGIVKTGRVPTGESTILGGIIGKAVKEGAQKAGDAIAPVVSSVGSSIARAGSGLVSSAGNLIEQSGLGTVLTSFGGMFGGGGPPKPPSSQDNIRTQQAEQAALRKKPPAGALETPVPENFPVKPTILGAMPTGPTMARGAVVRRRQAAMAAKDAMAAAEAKQAAAQRTASWMAAQAKVQAVFASQARLTQAREAQVAAQTAARTAAATLGQVVALPNTNSAFDNENHPDTNMAVYRANREAIGGPITQQSINRSLSSGSTLYRPG
jgi:GH24 family phage-related lysozyme (muramidase)